MKREVSLALMVALVASALPITAMAQPIEPPGSTRETRAGPLAQRVAAEAITLATPGERIWSGGERSPQSATLTDFAWTNLRTLKPGTEVLITVRGSQPARRYFLRATESELVVLNLADPALLRDARRVLLAVASTRPEYFATADRRETFVNGAVRVAPDGVFVADKKVADFGQVVEHVTRDTLVSIVAIGGADGSPEQAVTSFEELRALVRAGETVYVTDANGKTTKGRLGELSGSTLELLVAKEESDGRRTFVPQPRRSERDVREIQIEHPDPLWNGAVIGFASGGIAPALALSGIEGGCYGRCPNVVATVLLIGGGLGAALGAGIDYLNRDRITIYQAPGQRSSGLRISPLLSKSAAGVQMSVRF